MYRVILFCVLLLPGTSALAAIMDSEAFINEFHYDNEGSDRLEFVEIVCPEDWLDPDLLSLTLYNGSSGTAYGRPYGLDRFTLGEVVNGYRLLVLDVSMQNGAPDGFAWLKMRPYCNCSATREPLRPPMEWPRDYFPRTSE